MRTSDFWPKYAATIGFGGQLCVGDLGKYRLVAEDQDAVREVHELVDLAGEDHDAHAFGAEPVQDCVDLPLGPDVNPSGGVIEQQDLGVGGKPAGQQHLLLVAAGQGGDGVAGGTEAQGQQVGEGLEPAGSAAGVQQPAAAVLSQGGEREVFADRHGLEQRLAATFARQVGHTQDIPVALGKLCGALGEEAHDAAGPTGHTGQALDELVLAVALEPREAHDLASAQLEVDGCRGRCQADGRPLKDGVPGNMRLPPGVVMAGVSGHVRDQAVDG